MKDEQDKEESKLFFSYFYWSINLGALFSYTIVAYIAQYGLSFLGGKPWGFFCAYIIPAIMLAIGIYIFYSGSPRYKKNPPEGSMIPTILVSIRVRYYYNLNEDFKKYFF